MTDYSLFLSGGDIVDRIHGKHLKAVQLLTEKFTYKNWGLQELGEKPFEKCAEKRCYAFKTQRFLQTPLERSDGVMVHAQNLFYMPSRRIYKRNSRQLWLLNTMEPQTLSFCSLYYKIEDLDDWFNITSTFKAKSTLLTDYKNFKNWQNIHEYYLYYQSFLNAFEQIGASSIDESTRDTSRSLVLWFVSHCHTPSKRENYVNELRKFIKIDVFGKCGFAKPDPCRSKENKDECTIQLYNSYKFYLAFENSDCDEYISEKYWKIYRSDFLFRVSIVPVVRGARLEHYEQVAPSANRSFIYAESFSSPQMLAEFLLYLDRNQSAYMEYFDWKRKLFERFKEHVRSNDSQKVINRTYRDDTAVFCEMCSKLHNATFMNAQNEIIKISDFFNPVKDCRNGENKKNFFEFLLNVIGYCI